MMKMEIKKLGGNITKLYLKAIDVLKKTPSQENGPLKVTLNKMVRRQTPDSRFSYFDGTDDELIGLVKQNFPLKKEGNKEGSYIIPISIATNNHNFYTNIIALRDAPSHYIRSVYASKKSGENRRLSTSVLSDKKIGKYVEIVLYSKELLQQMGRDSSKDSDYEIMSLNVYPDKNTPHHYTKLLDLYKSDPYNFNVPIEEIMRSIDYWSNHAYMRLRNTNNELISILDDFLLELLVRDDKERFVSCLRKKGHSLVMATEYYNKLKEMTN